MMRKPTACFAYPGIDIALWDICGKAAGVPTWQLLGEPAHDAERQVIRFLVDGAELDDATPYARVVYVFDGRDEAAVSQARAAWHQARAALLGERQEIHPARNPVLGLLRLVELLGRLLGLVGGRFEAGQWESLDYICPNSPGSALARTFTPKYPAMGVRLGPLTGLYFDAGIFAASPAPLPTPILSMGFGLGSETGTLNLRAGYSGHSVRQL